VERTEPPRASTAPRFARVTTVASSVQTEQISGGSAHRAGRGSLSRTGVSSRTTIGRSRCSTSGKKPRT